MEIHLIRHTQPDVPKGICYGQTDLDLVPEFKSTFPLIHEQLRSDTLNLYDRGFQLHSSPLKRCLKLAEKISEKEKNQSNDHSNSISRTKVPIHVDARIQELNFGEWEMIPWNDIPRSQMDPWAQDYENIAPPQGETVRQMQERVTDFIHSLDDDVHLITTHSGVIRVLWAYWHQKPLQEAFKQEIGYGQICSFIDKIGPQF